MEWETSWLAVLPAGWLAAGLMLAAAPQAVRLLERVLVGGAQLQSLPAVLHWPPRWLRPLPWTVLSTLAAGLAAALLRVALPLPAAVSAALPVGGLMLVLAAVITRQRARQRLDAALVPAVGRLSALLSGGTGLRAALEQTIGTLDDALLVHEWRLLLHEPGRPLPQGGVITLRQVLTALALQTLSTRHAVLLQHIAAAIDQPHDVTARRCAAAYAALQLSARRRAEAQAELAQMRYSGLAIGLAGIVMALYLALAQWPRVVAAYGHPAGRPVALFVLISLLAPVIGALFLSEVGDVDY